MAWKTLDDMDLAGKRVLTRVDINVPMEDGRITDATRIERLVPTIADIRAQGGSPVLLAHFGRPKGQYVPEMSLRPLVWVTIGYVAIFASATTFTLLQFATLRLPSAKVMAYTYLTPSWVILWEIALGRDVPPALVLGGVGLTIVALLMLLRED